jgi:hypothetical protein
VKTSITPAELKRLKQLQFHAEQLHQKIDKLTEEAAELLGYDDTLDEDVAYDRVFDLIQNDAAIAHTLELLNVEVRT